MGLRSRSGPDLLAQLTGHEPICSRLLIVVAHPDDETITLGGQMWRLRDVLLLHVTDGAPRDGEDAQRLGFTELQDYAAARQNELAAALVAGEANGVRTAALGVPDKEAFLDLTGLSRQILQWVRRERPAAVLTHPYEGGHPDHDATAFAAHAACRLAESHERPVLIEMPFYHARDGQMVVGMFLPGPTDELVVPLGDTALLRKQRMVDCFRTQREMLCRFPLNPERFRIAPDYDFRQPPHAGALLYETFGWDITAADWRLRATAALEALGL
jgi:LmbE family N-acetylglucosaminyl deacetylase